MYKVRKIKSSYANSSYVEFRNGEGSYGVKFVCKGSYGNDRNGYGSYGMRFIPAEVRSGKGS